MAASNALLINPNIAIGLELEFEGTPSGVSSERLESYDLHNMWEAHTDGSLRPRDYNTEFTFRGPLVNNIVGSAVRGLCGMMNEFDNKCYTVSWRCGMHAHMDQRSALVETIYLEAVLSCFLDRVWFAWDGTGRQESKFCVPTAQIWQHMLHEGSDQLKGYKYTGLNITRAFYPDICTTEYRYAASTRNPDRMLEYITLCQWCVNLVRTVYTTPKLLIDSFIRARNYEQWFSNCVDNDTILEFWQPGWSRIMGGDKPTAGEFAAAIGLASHYSDGKII